MRERNLEKVCIFPATYKGKSVWFTDDRIELPKDCGLYKYELRYSDELEGDPVELAETILVDFYGTIISSEPINLPLPHLIPCLKYDSIDIEEGDFMIDGQSTKIIKLSELIKQEKSNVREKANKSS